jgi:predicted RNA-binding protein
LAVVELRAVLKRGCPFLMENLMNPIDSIPGVQTGRDLLQDIADRVKVRMTHRLSNQQLKDAIKRNGVFSFSEENGLCLFDAKGEVWVDGE